MGWMKVRISGQITGQPEADNLAQVAMSGHYAAGPWSARFEREFSRFMGARHAILCNSGSSANLLALAALELPKGSEVLTTAVNFPTTVNAIIQLGLVPVFVDSDPKTLGPWPEWDWGFQFKDIEAMIFAHTLGNPVDLYELGKYNIPLIEDCCDAVGSTIRGRMVGRGAAMSTVSFYPAHHMTMGEGGCVLTDSPRLKRVIESFRDWGRDCWCEPGEDNTCGTRWDGEYDHKYTYSRIGYNLKATDLQAAVGVAQMERLPDFIRERRRNWTYLRSGLDGLPIEFVEETQGSEPSWFGFPFLAQDRKRLARFLDGRGIGNRPIMAGNLLRQPAYKNIEHRVIGTLEGANKIHEQGMWIGCWPGIDESMMDYVIDTMREFYA
jgi:CDP-6-deoxy-D-xylo-4-hexulose-3-dehydrase